MLHLSWAKKMLEVAKSKTDFPQIEYKRCAMEDVDFPDESFDIVFSSLAFHYVEDYEALIKKIYKMLKPGGDLVFTVEHLLSLPPMDLRIGITMKKERFCISRWIIIFMKES